MHEHHLNVPGLIDGQYCWPLVQQMFHLEWNGVVELSDYGIGKNMVSNRNNSLANLVATFVNSKRSLSTSLCSALHSCKS